MFIHYLQKSFFLYIIYTFLCKYMAIFIMQPCSQHYTTINTRYATITTKTMLTNRTDSSWLLWCWLIYLLSHHGWYCCQAVTIYSLLTSSCFLNAFHVSSVIFYVNPATSFRISIHVLDISAYSLSLDSISAIYRVLRLSLISSLLESFSRWISLFAHLFTSMCVYMYAIIL